MLTKLWLFWRICPMSHLLTEKVSKMNKSADREAALDGPSFIDDNDNVPGSAPQKRLGNKK